MKKNHKQASSSFMEISGICLPIAGEKISGDSWDYFQTDKRCMIIVADGLGHGPEASAASELACEIFRDNTTLPPSHMMPIINQELRKTRGAAVSIMEIDKTAHVVNFSGLGNVSGALITPKKMSHFITHAGTAGIGQYHVKELTYAWNSQDLLLMYSDGLISRWCLSSYPALKIKHPSIIAATLCRDFSRGNDDLTVVVGKLLHHG